MEVAVNKLEKLNQTALSEFLIKLENKLNADIFTYYGEIVNGVEREVKDIIEALAGDPNKHCAIYVFLTTPGGSLPPVGPGDKLQQGRRIYWYGRFYHR